MSTSADAPPAVSPETASEQPSPVPSPSAEASKNDDDKLLTPAQKNEMSLMKVALGVLRDQAKQGVHGLTVQQLWSLITDDRLFVSSGKTPTYTLSGMFSTHIKNFGEKSLVIRVAKGQYGLRPNATETMEDLERLLREQKKYAAEQRALQPKPKPKKKQKKKKIPAPASESPVGSDAEEDDEEEVTASSPVVESPKKKPRSQRPPEPTEPFVELVDPSLTLNFVPQRSALQEMYGAEGGCRACGGDFDQDLILLCDACDAEYHTYCLKPPLKGVPRSAWFCAYCAGGRHGIVPGLKTQNAPQEEPAKEEESDDEEAAAVMAKWKPHNLMDAVLMVMDTERKKGNFAWSVAQICQLVHNAGFSNLHPTANSTQSMISRNIESKGEDSPFLQVERSVYAIKFEFTLKEYVRKLSESSPAEKKSKKRERPSAAAASDSSAGPPSASSSSADALRPASAPASASVPVAAASVASVAAPAEAASTVPEPAAPDPAAAVPSAQPSRPDATPPVSRSTSSAAERSSTPDIGATRSMVDSPALPRAREELPSADAAAVPAAPSPSPDRGEAPLKKAKTSSEANDDEAETSSIDSAPGSAVEAAVPQQQPSPAMLAAQMRENQGEWLGPPIGEKLDDGRRATYYDAVRYRDVIYRIGQCARFQSPQSSKQPYLARIVALKQVGQKKRVECLWYWQPEETHSGRIETDHPSEVFLGTKKNTNELSVIVCHAEVVSWAEWKTRSASGTKDPQLFFARRYYMHKLQARLPLPDEDIDPAYWFHYPSSGPAAAASLESETPTEALTRKMRLMLVENQFLRIKRLKALEKKKMSERKVAALRRRKDCEDNLQELKEFETWQKEQTRMTLLLPQNWPKDVKYTHEYRWDGLDETVRRQVNPGIIPGVAILPIPINGDHPASGEYGLFATIDWPRDKIIGEYAGIVVMNNASKRLLNHRYLTILCDTDELSMDVDAEHAGNETRFINDYRDTGKKANVRFEFDDYGGMRHLLVRTTRDVRKGEEFLVDYGSQWWLSAESSKSVVKKDKKQ